MTEPPEQTDNPYAIPTARLSKKLARPTEIVLASRGERLLAYVLDVLILSLAMFIGAMVGVIILVNTSQNPQVLFEYVIEQMNAPAPSLWAINIFDKWVYLQVITPLVLYFLINGYLLQTRGQTFGKSLMSIAIIDKDSQEVPPISTILLRRYIPFNSMAIVNVVLQLLIFFSDVLSIFREDKRMLHDLAANTIVIKV